MSQREKAAAACDDLERRISQVRDVAAAGAGWDELLVELGVTALADDVRERHRREGASLRPGAPLPMEFRWALEAIEAPVRARRDALYQASFDHGHDDVFDATLDKLERRLGNFVRDELKTYLQAMRPQVSTSSIFGNALATTTNHLAASAAAGTAGTNCEACGAPRGSDNSASCEFCGSPLAPV